MTMTRTGEAFEFDEQLTVVGPRLQVGAASPSFVVEQIDPMDGEIRRRNLAGPYPEVRILNVINSVDTPVCSTSLTRWDQFLEQAPDDVSLATISMDLPFALERVREAQGIQHDLLSAHKTEAFGISYGVLIREWRLLQRAVFVIGCDGRLLYTEYIADQMAEPDYRAASLVAIGARGSR